MKPYLGVKNSRACRAAFIWDLFEPLFFRVAQFQDISNVMENLSELYLDGTSIKEMPSSINKLTGLAVLNLSGCQELKSLLSSIHMGSLRTLILSGCSMLEKFLDISDVMEKLSRRASRAAFIWDLFKPLIFLLAQNFEKFLDISDVIEKLSKLYLDGTTIKKLPSSIRNLPGLITLNLRDCKKLESPKRHL
ncbi:disease resistance-like protein DSC1 [Malus domestica]|uniref:disease resistance-like protein DSC1 n=1 Tax=Malus domestica TaxID=3750 RepID=UPI003976ABAC